MPVVTTPKKDRFASAAEAAAEAGRAIQQQIDRREKARPKKEKQHSAMQAGSRRYPEPPFPEQHHPKPGEEAHLDPRPMYDAPHYKGSEKLKGKVALVTGGDSGIGRAVAVLFAREGADVAIAYLNEHQDADTTKKAIEKEGRRAITISGDVADPEFCKEAVERTANQLGGIDVLVNNAAFQEHVSDFEDLTEIHFDRTLKTNLYGYFHMAKAAIPHMKAGSSIIMTGSVTGLLGNKDLLDYSMTKGGIHAFVRSLATHLIDKGIRVNAVAPGPVWTPLNPADRDRKGITRSGSDTPHLETSASDGPVTNLPASSPCSLQDHKTGQLVCYLTRTTPVLTTDARHSRKRSLPPSSFSPRRVVQVTSPARFCDHRRLFRWVMPFRRRPLWQRKQGNTPPAQART